MGERPPLFNKYPREKGRSSKPGCPNARAGKSPGKPSGSLAKKPGSLGWHSPSSQMTIRYLSGKLQNPSIPLNSSNFVDDYSHDYSHDYSRVRKSRAVHTHPGHPEHVQRRPSPGNISRAWQSTDGPLSTLDPVTHNVIYEMPRNEAQSKSPQLIQRPGDASTATIFDPRQQNETNPDAMEVENPSAAQISTYPQESLNSQDLQGHRMAQIARDHDLSEIPEPESTMFKQPMTTPITEEQLIKEVRDIYSGLVMVEKKCIELDRQQMESKAELLESQWQALISLHRTLLYEHHDFFLASQHPSASSVLRNLAVKYAMPARMWRYGIHSLLELLRQNLPHSLDYMLNFIYVAYSMMTLLYESVRAFQETWIECLGDLARYRMAVEESDLMDREIWAGVSRYWYNLDADRSPDVGRIQHHLAVLARGDGLLQLLHYTKSLICVWPFRTARESIVVLFNPYKEQPLSQTSIITSFIATHGILFAQDPEKQFSKSAKNFLSLLREENHAQRREGQQGVLVTCCNIASILQYGKPDAVMEIEFSEKPGDTAEAAHKFAKEWYKSKFGMDLDNCSTDMVPPHSPSDLARQASALTFATLSIFLDQANNSASYASIHTSLAFIWCLALHPTAMQQLERMIPWGQMVKFLNILIAQGGSLKASKIQGIPFPLADNDMVEHLAEDFAIRGNVWSQLYYPDKFFENAPPEDERPIVDTDKTTFTRVHRCLWLGCRIATFERWISYDARRNQKFEITPFANSFDFSTELHGGLH